MRGKRKRADERVLRTTITIHPKVFETAKRRVSDLGYPDFSTFISELIRQESGRGVTVTVRSNPA